MATLRTLGVTLTAPSSSPDGKRVAQVFKEVRADRGITQEEAARRAGLTLAGYRPYEQGRRQLRLEQLPMFAKAFGISVDALAARLGIGGAGLRELQFAECAEILSELADEPPEVTRTILSWLRQSIAIAKLGRPARPD